MQTDKDWYKSWFDSKYYPILYQDRNEHEAQQFVDALMQYLQIPQDAIVADMACGEGRFAKQLSKYTAKVMGFDLSNERIQKAKERYEDEHTSFYVHDMRQPMHVNYFDYVFNFFTSFGYFDTYRDHFSAAKSMSNALKEQGILVIDYFNNNYIKKHLVPSEQKQVGDIVFDIKRTVADGKIIKSIRFKDEEGILNHFEERVSDVSKENFENLFNKAGLQLIQTFGDYQLNAFDNNVSPRLIMVFKKQ